MATSIMFKDQPYIPLGTKGVVIKLQPYPEEDQRTDSGIIVPNYETYETDGGRFTSRKANEKFSLIGQVLAISDAAAAYCEKENIPLSEHDVVIVYDTAKSPTNWIIPERSVPVADFDGFIQIHPNHVQAIIGRNEESE